MPAATQKLALEIEAQSEKALDDLDRLKTSINEVSATAEASSAQEDKATAARNKATKSLKQHVKVQTEMTTAAKKSAAGVQSLEKTSRAAARQITAVSGDIEELTGSLTEGDTVTQQFAGSISTGVSALLTMGPAAAGIVAGMELAKWAIKAVRGEIERLNTMRIRKDIIEGTYEWAGGLEEMKEKSKEAAEEIADLTEEVKKYDKELGWSGLKLEGAAESEVEHKQRIFDTSYALGQKTAATDELNKKTEENIAIKGDYNKYVRETTIADAGSLAASWQLIEAKKDENLITEKQKRALAEETVVKYAHTASIEGLIAFQKEYGLVTQETTRATSVQRDVEYDLVAVELERLEYVKAALAQIPKLIDKEQILLLLYKEELTTLPALIATYNALRQVRIAAAEAGKEDAKDAAKAAEEAAERRERLEERMQHDIIRITQGTFVYKMKLLKEEAERLKDAGADKLLIQK